MIDIHSHILPSIDDGSRDMDMSIDMAKLYIGNGFKKIVATPHYIEGLENSSRSNNRIKLKELQANLREEGIGLEVYMGHEVMISLDLIKKLKDGFISSLNGSKYVLIELPMYDIPLYTENVFYNLQLMGYVPILAHPERNLKIIEDPNILLRYVRSGVLAQLNLPSLEEKYGRDVKNTAKILLRHNLIHFVSSDAHSSSRRSPEVSDAIKILKTLVGEGQFRKLTSINASLVLEGKSIEIETPIEYKSKKSFFDIFKKRRN